jgi:hypothetical protein
VSFPERFNGPPGSANGGYACGVIAQQISSDLVEVTLRRPPPLDTMLFVERTAEKYAVRSESGDTIAVGQLMGEPITADPAVFEVPADAPSALPGDRHPFRTCFTCGPDRAPGDGLHIFAKRIPGQAVLADRWTPDQSLADSNGSVRPEIVCASLDCPGGWAAFDRILGGVAVLGRMAAQVKRTPVVGEPCVVVASTRWHDGRKIDAHSALYSCEGSWWLRHAQFGSTSHPVGPAKRFDTRSTGDIA